MTTNIAPSVTDELLADIQREFDRNGPCPHFNRNPIGAGTWIHCDDCGRQVGIEYLEQAQAASEKHGDLSISLRAILSERAELKRDAERLDKLDRMVEAYGFEGGHEGNRWVIDGPFRDIRVDIDSIGDDQC